AARAAVCGRKAGRRDGEIQAIASRAVVQLDHGVFAGGIAAGVFHSAARAGARLCTDDDFGRHRAIRPGNAARRAAGDAAVRPRLELEHGVEHWAGCNGDRLVVCIRPIARSRAGANDGAARWYGDGWRVSLWSRISLTSPTTGLKLGAVL